MRRLRGSNAGPPAYLFYSSVQPSSVQGVDLLSEHQWSVWRPMLKKIMPRGVSYSWIRFVLRWLIHRLGLIEHCEYQVLVVRHVSTDEVVHYSGATGRYWRWPFMDAQDIQIGDTWTHPVDCGRGLAKFALVQLLRELAAPEWAFHSAAAVNETSDGIPDISVWFAHFDRTAQQP